VTFWATTGTPGGILLSPGGRTCFRSLGSSRLKGILWRWTSSPTRQGTSSQAKPAAKGMISIIYRDYVFERAKMLLPEPHSPVLAECGAASGHFAIVRTLRRLTQSITTPDANPAVIRKPRLLIGYINTPSPFVLFGDCTMKLTMKMTATMKKVTTPEATILNIRMPCFLPVL
jgi:hypothetical protein